MKSNENVGYRSTHNRRYTETLDFIEKHIAPGSTVLDLGVENYLSDCLTSLGHKVINTKGENLDIDYTKYSQLDVEYVTAFQIFEHMLAPFNFLRTTKSKKLLASIPLKLWFTSAYWNEKELWDKHYHEFEQKQFDFLHSQSGWKIIDSKKWKAYNPKKIGIRPLLRRFYNRYYIVYCERE